MDIIIAGKRIALYNNVSINLQYNSIADSFSFSAYFNPSSNRDLFKPSLYSVVQILHKGVVILTGRVLAYNFKSAGDPPEALIEVSGASVTEVLSVCPVVTTPTMYTGLTIEQIVQKVCRHYSIGVIVDPEVQADCNKILTVAYPKIDQTVKDYIDSITKQLQIVVSHTATGQILLTRVKADKVYTRKATRVKPVARSEQIEGAPEFIATVDVAVDRPVLFDFVNGTYISMDLSFDGADMHSDIMILGQSQPDTANSVQLANTAINPYVEAKPIIYSPLIPDAVDRGVRPLNVVQTVGDSSTLPLTSRAEVGRELKNIKLTIQIEGWELNEHLVTPNQMITVTNPFVHLYKKTKWFIQEVKLVTNESSTTATLTCVLPECFSDEPIKNIFDKV
jgi:prophage tail gpP-like protein